MMTEGGVRRTYNRTGVSTETLVTRVRALIRAHQLQCADGLSVPQVRSAYERVHGALSSRRAYDVLWRLIEDEGLVAVSGRPPAITYGYPDLPRPARPDALGDRLVRAVEEAGAALGACPSTHQVLEQLDRDGGPRLDRHVVQRALLALITADDRVPSATWLLTPRLERLEVLATSGAKTVHWRLAGATTPLPAVTSETEVVRRLLALAEAGFQRPVSRPELLWFMQHVLAHGTDDERALCASMPTPHLDHVLAINAQQADRMGIPEGRLGVRRFDPLALQAGPHRTRFTLASAEAMRSPVCDVEHAADVLSAASERDSMALLRQRVAKTSAPGAHALLSAVHTLREAAMYGVLVRLLPYSAEELEHAAALAMQSARTMAQWLKTPPVLLGTTGAPNVNARVLTARRRIEDVDAVLALMRAGRMSALLTSTAPIQSLGDAAVLSPNAARALVDQIAAPVNPTLPKERLTYLAAARRVVPTGYQGRRGYAGIDRVDAAVIACRADDQPRAHTLIESAHRMLGHVLRDGPRLEALLGEHPHADAADRRALVVACALLGHVVPVELAVPDPRELLDTRAYLLACALGDPAGAVRRIAGVDRRAVGAAREVTDTALARAEGGLLLAVIG
ncbi:hypothetical protein [Gemmatimonas sp.]|uniref:hypothetical protein n=1 Tax=Gemmatimonas sp. TaxID=1962908 RepID=UPI0025C715DD|nr:hypothetical protein [Gemmatimonas sp.]MCA2991621.1 hypothetical protein [Gemmatimonas sp.]